MKTRIFKSTQRYDVPFNVKQRSYKKGLWGERAAALYFRFKGYNVLETRYKTRFGEIDLICQKGSQLIFAEVKCRARIGEALAAVDKKTMWRIEKAARSYIGKNPDYNEHELRFDAVAIQWRPFRFVHLDNAWKART